MKVIPNYNNQPVKKQPAFKAKFDLKVVEGVLNIPPKEMDIFVDFFNRVGTEKDNVEAIVRNVPSGEYAGYNNLSVKFNSLINGKSESSDVSCTYLANSSQIRPVKPAGLLFGFCHSQFFEKTQRYRDLIANLSWHKNS